MVSTPSTGRAAVWLVFICHGFGVANGRVLQFRPHPFVTRTPKQSIVGKRRTGVICHDSRNSHYPRSPNPRNTGPISPVSLSAFRGDGVVPRRIRSRPKRVLNTVASVKYIGDLEEEDFEDEDEEQLFTLSHLSEDEAMEILEKQPDLVAIDELAKSDGGNGGLLCIAASRGYQRVIDFLLKKGSNVNYRKDDFSLTPLAHAVVKGHTDVAVALIDNGARINMVGIDPRYMVTTAIQTGDTRLFHRLVTEGIDVHQPYSFADFEKRTQLDVAVDIGQEGFAELLLDLGVDPYAGRGFAWMLNRAKEMKLDRVLSRLQTYSRGQKPSLEIPIAPSLRKAVPLPEEEQVPEETAIHSEKEERLKWQRLVDQFYEQRRKGEGGALGGMELLDDDDLEDEVEDTAVRPFWETAKPEDILWNPKTDEPDKRSYGYEPTEYPRRTSPISYDAEDDSFDLDKEMVKPIRGGFIRNPDSLVVDQRVSKQIRQVFRTPEVRRSLKVLGMDPEEEFDMEDIAAQFRIMLELADGDQDREERLNIARDFLMGKLMDLR